MPPIELNPLLFLYKDFIAFKRPWGVLINFNTKNSHLCPTEGKAAAKSNRVRTGRLLMRSRSWGVKKRGKLTKGITI